MSTHPTLRHFKKGISLTTQWTGTEHKNMQKVFLGVLAKATEPRVIHAARGILDFIYYAQFEVQTDESLSELDAAWRAFHENKEVFVDLDIRQHFNISKLHNIRHYLDSIRELGSATGFNTEATERLHIDLAKAGYRASNKKEYTRQMVTWLRRQEAVSRFRRYLEWALVHGQHLQSTRKGSEDSDARESDEDMDDSDVLTQIHTTCHRVAKVPAFPRVTATTIVDDYGAVDFLHNLSLFFQQHSIRIPDSLSSSSTFAVYRRLHLMLPLIPEVSSTCIHDKVIATRAEKQRITTRGIKKAVPGQHSTILVRTEVGDSSKGPLHGEYY
ncbi:hypothetical protein H0H92_009320 [Tricholoma furcatifolium]|nr:hypothetical protein H0H92_009320 [Tricholoma furcatifolium]